MSDVARANLPRPTWSDLSVRTNLSAARRRVLETVEAAAEPLTATEVAKALNLHHNTVREHLDSLVDAGFVRSAPRPTGKRGRPALLYSPTAPDPTLVLASYLTLLDAIAATLGDGEQARSTALEIGRRWAEMTPPAAMAKNSTTGGVAEALLPSLALMGFSPELLDNEIVLRSCPMILDGRGPDPLVCLMHEGFLRAVAKHEGITVVRPSAGDDQETPEAASTAALTPGCRILLPG